MTGILEISMAFANLARFLFFLATPKKGELGQLMNSFPETTLVGRTATL